MSVAGFINPFVQIAQTIALNIGIVFIDTVVFDDVLFKKVIFQSRQKGLHSPGHKRKKQDDRIRPFQTGIRYSVYQYVR